MVKKVVGLVIVALVLFVGGNASAWECNANDGTADCYVQYVEIRVNDEATNNDTYVLAGLYDPHNLTPCTAIRVVKGVYQATTDTIRGTESILLTAMTTGLPIMFTGTVQNGICNVDVVVIDKR
jgi:hypothetical protein